MDDRDGNDAAPPLPNREMLLEMPHDPSARANDRPTRQTEQAADEADAEAAAAGGTSTQSYDVPMDFYAQRSQFIGDTALLASSRSDLDSNTDAGGEGVSGSEHSSLHSGCNSARHVNTGRCTTNSKPSLFYQSNSCICAREETAPDGKLKDAAAADALALPLQPPDLFSSIPQFNSGGGTRDSSLADSCASFASSAEAGWDIRRRPASALASSSASFASVDSVASNYSAASSVSSVTRKGLIKDSSSDDEQVLKFLKRGAASFVAQLRPILVPGSDVQPEDQLVSIIITADMMVIAAKPSYKALYKLNCSTDITAYPVPRDDCALILIVPNHSHPLVFGCGQPQLIIKTITAFVDRASQANNSRHAAAVSPAASHDMSATHNAAPAASPGPDPTRPAPPPPPPPPPPPCVTRPQLFFFCGKCSASIYIRGCVQAVAAVSHVGTAEVTCWAVAVAGSNQEMRVYNENPLLSTTVMNDHPSGLVRANHHGFAALNSMHPRVVVVTRLQVFGRFGREDSTAIITHKGGSLARNVRRISYTGIHHISCTGSDSFVPVCVCVPWQNLFIGHKLTEASC